MDISLPNEIQSLIQKILEEVNADSKHRLKPQRRRQIYESLKKGSDSYGHQSCKWLAILAAKRVLPIFQKEFPENTLPKELLTNAIGVLEGKKGIESAYNIQDQGYHAAGNTWGHDESEISWNADMSGRAAYNALKETRGQTPFSDLDKYFKLGEVVIPSGNIVTEYPKPISATEYTDEDLCQIEPSDTASCAAVAFSCRPDGPYCDPAKLLEFWTWWLSEGIPEAWKLAQL